MKTQFDSGTDVCATNADSQQVITLVHGTWARNATWVKPDSRMCKHLRELDPNVIIRSFQWSGGNSHRARLKAADALVKQLSETFSQYRTAEHHIVAHSHGGNVALYALRDPGVCARIASVVCLATPFIHVEARPLKPALSVLRLLVYSAALGSFAVLAFASILFMLMSVLYFPESELAVLMRSMGLPRALTIMGIIALSGLTVWAAWRAARTLIRWIDLQLRPRIERYQRKLVSKYKHRAPRPVSVLNAQVEGDEPALWLRALRWVSEPTSSSIIVIPVAAMAALAFGGALMWSFIEEGLNDIASIVIAVTLAAAGVFFVWLVVFTIGVASVHLTFIAVPLLVRAHGGGFGEWSIFANWVVAIEARTEPAGGFRVESFRMAPAGKGLRHSRIYHDERVIERIGKWLEDSAQHQQMR
jgi:pimeloyl-ACP methyl ester carboxylesterase